MPLSVFTSDDGDVTTDGNDLTTGDTTGDDTDEDVTGTALRARAWQSILEQSRFNPRKLVRCDDAGSCLQQRYEGIPLYVRQKVKHLKEKLALTAEQSADSSQNKPWQVHLPGARPARYPLHKQVAEDTARVVADVLPEDDSDSQFGRRSGPAAAALSAAALVTVGVLGGSPIVEVCLPAAVRGLVKLTVKLGHLLVRAWRSWGTLFRSREHSTAMVASPGATFEICTPLSGL